MNLSVPQWASWALKSLSGKFYKGTPPPQSGPVAPQQPAEVSSSREGTPKPPEGQISPQRAASEISTVTDGWDDLDDDTDFSKQAMHKDDRTQEGSA
ncbi:unnamed protein product, partial [Toxocara canis]|uniref:Myelin basic protein n=1 Tax=Toxocara canis TaxID=6265 RepID=A0A183U987_TOXCA